MILFSLYSLKDELCMLYIGYMEDERGLLTVEYCHPRNARWEKSAMSSMFTPSSLLAWLELNYPNHEIYHMEIP